MTAARRGWKYSGTQKTESGERKGRYRIWIDQGKQQQYPAARRVRIAELLTRRISHARCGNLMMHNAREVADV